MFEPNWWEKLWGARNCCAPSYAQTNYAAVETKSEWNSNASWDSSWSWPWSSKDVQINNNGNVYVMRDGVSVNGLRPSYAAVEPRAFEAETYVQPAPRYYRQRAHYRTRYTSRPRVVVRTVYRTRVVYARPRPRPHVLVPGNPSSSAGTYDVAPKKVLRP